MSAKLNLLGHRFGRMLVTGPAEYVPKHVKWTCLCDCGNTTIKTAWSLRSGSCRSCGCLRRENTASMFTKHGNTKDGKLSPEYRAWVGMITRCKYTNRPDFKWYGSQGVTVCLEWQTSFESFLEYVGRKPTLEHSLDRIDPFGNYEPGNVRWTTRSEQARNTRKSKAAA